MRHSFQCEGINLEYEIFGTGKQPLFAFHGFGNDASMFRVLEPSLGKKYTIYSFNLPFHGSSTVDEETGIHGIDTLQLQKFFRGFMWEVHTTFFSSAGFSIGGKIALKLIELFPDEVKEVFLFAPDGIKISFWYHFVTRSGLGRWTYKRMTRHPRRYMHIVRALEFMGLVHPRTANFVRSSLDSKEKRETIFNTWMCFRYLEPDTDKIRRIVNANGIGFHLFFGKFDKVIPPFIGKKYAKGFRQKNSFHLVNSGHQLVKEDLNEELDKILSA